MNTGGARTTDWEPMQRAIITLRQCITISTAKRAEWWSCKFVGLYKGAPGSCAMKFVLSVMEGRLVTSTATNGTVPVPDDKLCHSLSLYWQLSSPFFPSAVRSDTIINTLETCHQNYRQAGATNVITKFDDGVDQVSEKNASNQVRY